MPARIAVIGSSNIDLVTRATRIPAPGETLTADAFSTGAGGKGANQAVAAALNGAEVLFVTRVGDDAFGATLLEGYLRVGLDCRHALAVPGTPTGTATILVEQDGENRILVAPGANAALDPAVVDEAADALATCGLIVLQLEVPLATVHHALDWAAARAIPVLLNPAPIHPDLDLAKAAQATFLVPNQTELAALTGRPAGTRDEAADAATLVLEAGVATVIVTLGAAGALIVTPDATRHMPAPQVEARDTTGAGDAFIGAFAACWIATRDIDAAVADAVRYAADTTTRPGAQASYRSAPRASVSPATT